jgi:ferredoxin
MQLYTFSGTGNSLHAARALAARFPDAAIVPILRALQEDEVKTRAEVVGVVFPIHALTLPWVVRAFLEQADFSSASYIFAVSTRECFAKVFDDIDRLLARGGKHLDAGFAFEMPQNYIPVFETYSPEECARTEEGMREALERIEAAVAAREPHRPKDPAWLFPLSHIVMPLVSAFFRKLRFPNMERSFYADESCTGCGICESVCPTGKIRLADGKPVWRDSVRCAYCFACLHYCPSAAIQIKGRKTAEKGRYHHSAVKAADIAAQKGLDLS